MRLNRRLRNEQQVELYEIAFRKFVEKNREFNGDARRGAYFVPTMYLYSAAAVYYTCTLYMYEIILGTLSFIGCFRDDFIFDSISLRSGFLFAHLYDGG